MNWLKLRLYVFMYLAPRLRLHQFREAVAHAEARHAQRIRSDLWQLRAEGKIRGERDENGEMCYYIVDDDGE